MTNWSPVFVPRVMISTALAVLLAIAASPSAWASGTSDSDLRGYKGGLVELGLKSGPTVRGVLYGYTSEHLELEVASGRTVKLHRSRLKWLKAAPAGAKKSAFADFPRDAGLPSGTTAPRDAPAPTPPPATGTPSAAPRETPLAPTPGKAASPDSVGAPSTRARSTRTPKAKGLTFELKLGGTMYTPYSLTGYHPSAPVSADAMLGYKSGGFVIGMRIDFVMFEMESGGDTGRMWAVVFAPTFQFDLLNSWPLSMYGTMSFDIGPGVISGSGDDEVTPIVGFRAGAGMRFFVHPRFAIGAETGFRGFWMLDAKLGTVTIYGQLAVLFIW